MSTVTDVRHDRSEVVAAINMLLDAFDNDVNVLFAYILSLIMWR